MLGDRPLTTALSGTATMFTACADRPTTSCAQKRTQRLPRMLEDRPDVVDSAGPQSVYPHARDRPLLESSWNGFWHPACGIDQLFVVPSPQLVTRMPGSTGNCTVFSRYYLFTRIRGSTLLPSKGTYYIGVYPTCEGSFLEIRDGWEYVTPHARGSTKPPYLLHLLVFTRMRGSTPATYCNLLAARLPRMRGSTLGYYASY